VVKPQVIPARQQPLPVALLLLLLQAEQAAALHQGRGQVLQKGLEGGPGLQTRKCITKLGQLRVVASTQTALVAVTAAASQ
jgi:hypothetical protein